MKTILFDIDGTLADVRSIRHYVTDKATRNFDKFHRASLFVPTHAYVKMVLDAIHIYTGATVVLVTARDEKYRKVTTDWLYKHGIVYDRLYMRGYNDGRADHIVKTGILASVRADGYSPVHAFDDRTDIAKVWTDHGISVTLVLDDGTLKDYKVKK